MREYETVLITRSDCSPEQLEHIKDKINSVVAKHSGKVFMWRDMGSKTLAYPIKKEKKGQYAYVDYAAESACMKDLEFQLKYDEHILRFLSVVINDKVDVLARGNEIEKLLTEPSTKKEIDLSVAPVNDSDVDSEDARGGSDA